MKRTGRGGRPILTISQRTTTGSAGMSEVARAECYVTDRSASPKLSGRSFDDDVAMPRDEVGALLDHQRFVQRASTLPIDGLAPDEDRYASTVNVREHERPNLRLCFGRFSEAFSDPHHVLIPDVGAQTREWRGGAKKAATAKSVHRRRTTLSLIGQDGLPRARARSSHD